MAASLTRETWRAQIAQRLAALAADPQRALADAGTTTLYGFLLGSVTLPLAAAAAGGDPALITTAVTGLVGGIGANLISELVQRGHDDATRGAAIAQLADDPTMHPALQQLVTDSGVFELVTSALAGHTDQLVQLRAELQMLADRFGSTGPFAGTTLTNNVNQGQSGGVNAQGSTFNGPIEIVGGNKIIFATYQAPAPDIDAALRRYLGALCDHCDALPLLDPYDADPGRQTARLAAVFVPLETERMLRPTLTAEQQRNLDRYIPILKRFRSSPILYRELMQQAGIADFVPTPQRMLAAIAAQHRLVVTGDPGGGKSSALNFLALTLAQTALGRAGWRERLAEAAALAGQIPVRVLLREFAAWIAATPATKPSVQRLWDFLATQPDVGAPLSQDLARHWEAGEAILLLDGLDEVPANTHGQPLQAVLGCLAPLLHASGTGRVLITCRKLDYAAGARPPRRLAGWPEERIAPLTAERRAVFISRWFAALSALGRLRDRDPKTLGQSLLAQIGAREELRRLSANPLLLTMMALIQGTRGSLPDRRVTFYEDCLQLLWDQWRPIGAGETLAERLDLDPADRFDHNFLLNLLGHVAHARGVSGDGERGSDLPRALLINTAAEFFKRYDPPYGQRRNYTRAETFAEYIAAQSNGIVQEYSTNLFRFPHRTFQEYLAARYLISDEGDETEGEFVERALARLDRGDHWREAILLAVSQYVIRPEVVPPGDLALELLDRADTAADPLLTLQLLALLLREIGRDLLTRRKRYSGLWQDVIDRLMTQIAAPTVAGTEPEVAARRRIALAEALALLGDPRVPITDDHWRVERFDRTFGVTGDHYWRTVPAGTYRIGGWEPGKSAASFAMDAFWVARDPVTVAQYATFVKEGYGPHATHLWTVEGWKDVGKRAGPYDWFDPAYSAPNQPAIGVSWYEAMAFCAWLTERLADLLPPDYVVRLPTDAEWEVAAAYNGAGQRSDYPWGDAPAPTPDRAVYDWYAQEGRPAPIGTSPDGRAACGAEDLAGNIWEWTATRYTDYPARANGGLADMEPSLDMVPEKSFTIRGGSIWEDGTSVRCRTRSWVSPEHLGSNQGLRLFVAPRLLMRPDS